MAKSYFLQFGSGNPASYTGLSPTFTIFSMDGLTAISAPAIAETPSGSGFYKFTYGPTATILFLADGGATLSTSDRYISGTLDPNQVLNEGMTFLVQSASFLIGGMSYLIGGVTYSAVGVSAILGRIGATTDSFGSTAADPTTLFGYAKRTQEFNEGNASFNKSTGLWDIYSRGSSTLLIEKQLTNTASSATKT